MGEKLEEETEDLRRKKVSLGRREYGQRWIFSFDLFCHCFTLFLMRNKLN